MLQSLKKLLLVAGVCALPFTAVKAQFLSITVAPPPLPVYVQPACPVEGYLWTPGYWGYADDDFHWVPGAWVEPPRVGYLWTPGYWGFDDGLYVFHTGYWGPTVGFYGGVNYGGGYGGYGYSGGRWDGGRFRYNTAVTRVNTAVIRNTYVNKMIINERVTNSRASFNGPGGVRLRPTAQQLRVAQEPRLRPTAAQVDRRQEAAQDRGQFAAVNRGQPDRLTTAPAARRGEVDGRAERPMAGLNDGRAGSRFSDRSARRSEDREAGLQRTFDTGRWVGRGAGLTLEEWQLVHRRENRSLRNLDREPQERGIYGGGLTGRQEAAMRREPRPDFRRTEGLETRREAVQNHGRERGGYEAPTRMAAAREQVHAGREGEREVSVHREGRGRGEHERRERD